MILFGEHFVVYKVPALVGAVSAYTDCKLELIEGGDDNKKTEKSFSIVDDRPAVPFYKEKKAAEGEHAVELVLKHFKLQDSKNIKWRNWLEKCFEN